MAMPTSAPRLLIAAALVALGGAGVVATAQPAQADNIG